MLCQGQGQVALCAQYVKGALYKYKRVITFSGKTIRYRNDDVGAW